MTRETSTLAELADAARRLAHTDDEDRSGLLAWVQRAGGASTPVARQLARSRDPRVRSLAADILGQDSGEGATTNARLLARIRRDRSALVRVAVAASLGLIAGHGARVPVDALEDLARDQSEVVRERAAVALGAVPDRRATRLLARLCRDPVASVRSWAALGLGFRPHLDRRLARRCLVDLLADGEPEVQEEAIVALAQAHDPRAATVLVKLLRDHPPSELMLEAYSEWPTEELRVSLERWLEEARSRRDPDLETRIRRALAGAE